MNIMAITPTDREILKFISQLNSSQKEALMIFLRELLIPEINTERQSSAEYDLELKEALVNINKGEHTSLEDLESEMESW